MKITSIITLGVISTLLMTACAQAKPEPPTSTPSAAGSATTPPAPGPATILVEPGGVVTSAQGSTSLPLSEMTSNPPAQTQPALTPGGQKIITRDDQGKTIALIVGERFLLQLGEQYTWDISISDQTVLSRVINIAVVNGAQGVYEAHQTGTVKLTANGDPLCRQSQPPCMMPSIAFEITLVVK